MNLPLERGDVGLGGLARVLAGLDGVLLGGQAKGVPTHRMQHVEAERAFVSRQNIRCCVTFRMSDVQARAARIGKHVEDVKFPWQLRRSRLAEEIVALRKRMLRRDFIAGIPRAKCLLLIPKFPPFGFNQIKRILSATTGHRRVILRKIKRRSNRGMNPGVNV